MPKRKAQEDSDVVQPSPPKRSTRVSARRNEFELPAPSRSSTRINNSPQKPLRWRGSKSPLKKIESSSLSKRNGKQNLNPITRHEQEESGDDHDVDELNLSPPEPVVPCTTPPPSSRIARILMHSVEITTPRAFSSLLPTASPAPSTRHSPAKTRISAGIACNVPELVAASPSLPSTLQPPQTPNRRTKQTDQLPNSPSKDKLQSKSPTKNQLPCSMPQPATRIPRNLPPHLGACLRLQKRVMLAELQNCSMESDEDIGLSPTNTVAFQQLKDLLAGTVSRGEGNSCFVLGPRGSGKTTVSRLSLPVCSVN